MINIYQYIDGIKYIPDQYKRKVFEKVSYNVGKISQDFQTNNENIKKSYKNGENKETRNTYEKGIEDSLNSLKGICQELQGIRSDLSHRIQTKEKNISSSATISKEVGSENDDKCFISDDERSFGVFDGVAGHGGGHVAAEIAQKHIQQELDRLPTSMSGQDVERKMKEIIKNTHKEIKKQQQRSEYRKMSTTATVVKMLKDGTAVIGNIGDSRAYLYNENEGSLKQLTIDNAGSFPKHLGEDFLQRKQKNQELLAKIASYKDIDNLSKEYLNKYGFANAEQAKSAFDGRASINECLGNKQGLDFKIYHVQLNPGDKLLLTTDGAHDNLTDDEMKAIMQMKMNSGETSKGLASAAKLRSREYDPKISGKRAKPDDITVLVIDAGKFAKTKDRPSTSRDQRREGPNRWK
jgi:protein phosphatase